MRPPNPITQGFRAAGRNLSLFFLEIIWRWSFAAIAAVLIFQAGKLIMGQLQISDTVALAWRTQNSRLAAVIGLSIILKPPAILLRVMVELLALALCLALIWSIFAACARRITIRRLERAGSPLRFGGMMVVQWFRAMATIFASLLLLAAIVGGFYFATKSGRSDLTRFYLIVVPSALFLAIVWLVLNWHLSQAAIFGTAGQGPLSALREARRNIRRHAADFAGIAFIFLLLRLVLALIALAIIGLTSSMMATAYWPYLELCGAVLLAYCVLADFLYIARTAAYLALAAQPDPLAAEMGIIDPELPVEKSSSA